MNGKPVVQTQNLTKWYGREAAVDNLTLTMGEGEVFGFLGPNGAGKTTTILMLLGLSEPTSGWARVCGLDSAREAIKVKRLAGYLPENVGFYDDMNALQNLQYLAELNGIPKDKAAIKIQEALEVVGLSDEAGKRLNAYSRGMKQRLGIAEVLIKEPKVVFLDEPTIGLDPDGANRMIDLISSLSRNRKITVFFSSHNLQQVQKISDRIGIMIKGKLVAQGPIEMLAHEKLGVEREVYTLEEIYMKYFLEG
jgi:ABC-2 type transport system ATP-binding protein